MPGWPDPITLISAQSQSEAAKCPEVTMLLKLRNHVIQRIRGLRSRLSHFLLAEMNARLVQQEALLAKGTLSSELERLTSMIESSPLVRLEAMDLRTQAQEAEIERLSRFFESCMLRVSKIENESDVMLKHLTAQYQSLVQERDALLNERDRLLVGLQRAERPGGFAPNSAQVHAERLDFPLAALPAGTLPRVHIVDIGAQNLTQEGHIYLPLIKAGAALITGFEPLQDAAERRSAEDPSLTMLNHFIGDGSARKFHVNRDDTTSSLLPADLEFLGRFEALATMCSPVEIMDITTTKLDDIPEVADCDFLKIDVQGGE
jgi:hypothetical protein